MALECAAAATEAFVQQQQQPAVQVSTSKGSSSAAAGGFTLAGGVLPPSLVAAALPLIAGGPGVARRAVQRILLTLLPGAVKVCVCVGGGSQARSVRAIALRECACSHQPWRCAAATCVFHQGVVSDKQAGQLIDVVLIDIRRARLAGVAAEVALIHDAAVPGLTAAADALVRCCLRGPAPWPAAVLAVSRGLLQLRQQWAEGGYRSSGWGSSVRAHALLLLSNSLLAALAGEVLGWRLVCHGGAPRAAAKERAQATLTLESYPLPAACCRPPHCHSTPALPADATGHAALLSHQLPLDAAAFPSLQATPRGLVVNGAAADAGASLAAVRALEQQLPATQEHAAALHTTLSQVMRRATALDAE
jgi:hypothetical protein